MPLAPEICEAPVCCAQPETVEPHFQRLRKGPAPASPAVAWQRHLKMALSAGEGSDCWPGGSSVPRPRPLTTRVGGRATGEHAAGGGEGTLLGHPPQQSPRQTKDGSSGGRADGEGEKPGGAWPMWYRPWAGTSWVKWVCGRKVDNTSFERAFQPKLFCDFNNC